MAKTNDVTSTLNNCTITGNFYGGGNLGEVRGTATSTLNGCTVNGNVYGAGYSATVPTVDLMNSNTFTGTYPTGYPYYDINSGAYHSEHEIALPATTSYTWSSKGSVTDNSTAGSLGTDSEGNWIHTDEDLTSLGQVRNVVLKIDKYTVVKGTVSEDITGRIDHKVFGGGAKSNVKGDVTVTIQGSEIGEDVYGGGEEAQTNTKESITLADNTVVTPENPLTQVNLFGGTITGSLYGGGLGTETKAADVNGPVTVTVTGGKATNVYGCNNVNGAPKSTVDVNINGTDAPASNQNYTITNVFGGGNQAAYTGTPVVTVNNTSPVFIANVFGGGNEAEVAGTNVTIQAQDNTTTATNSKIGNVFGGGNEAGVTGNTSVSMVSGNVVNALYGGNNTSGTVGGSTSVIVTGGTVGTEVATEDGVFGGGYGENTNVTGDVTVSIGKYDASASPKISGTTDIKGDIYGGSAKGKVNNADLGVTTKTKKTQVLLYAGTVEGNVYGGGLGTADVAAQGENPAVEGIEALVYGDVEVKLNQNNGTAKVGGSVFGANNVKGTPKGTVTVDVYGTYDTGTKPDKLANYLTATDTEVSGHTYELTGVFGGGNLAAYVPETGKTTTVNIHGCDQSSIKEVYGGGNAASVPSCAVNVFGAYEIGYVYGGGKGTSSVAADVLSTAATTIYGGTIYRTFAGSNTNGDISGSSTLTIGENNSYTESGCEPKLGDVFSYGNMATMSGASSVNMGCLTNKVGALYGGAMNANVNNNITLDINGGTYAKVFGGNKTGGTIGGSITVNVEKTASCDLTIDELYGCGNQAAYTTAYDNNGTPSNYENPTINIYSCTSIGAVFGGGLLASVTGDPQINIQNGTHSYADANASCTIGEVYGGGSQALVTGNPAINIGTTGSSKTIAIENVFGGGKGVADTSAENEPDNGADANVVGTTTVNLYQGAVSENVYGGGNVRCTTTTANVYLTGGSVNTVYGGGKGHATTTTSANVYVGKYENSEYTGSTNIGGDVYGGSEEGVVGTAIVNLNSATLSGEVFGGGKGSGTGEETKATVTSATVNQNNIALASEKNIYGGCNVNGEVTTAIVNLLGGSVCDVFGGGQGHATTTTSATVYVGTDTSTGNTTVNGDVYGGSELGEVGTAIVNLNSATLSGEVFGGGKGSGTESATAATITTSATVNQNGITMASGKNIYGGCNVNGSAVATEVNLIGGTSRDVYGGGQGNHTTVSGITTVNVGQDGATYSGAATVTGDIYGGSAFGGVTTPTVNIYEATTLSGSIFGGGKGSIDDNYSATVAGDAIVNMYGATVKAIYGGCNEKGSVNGDIELNIIGGTVTKDADTDGIFGGGLGQNTEVQGDVTVNIGQYNPNATTKISGSAVITADVYGGSAEGKVNCADENNTTTTKAKTTTVNLYAGKITGNIYGGGLGDQPTSPTATDGVPAYVYGNVLVELNNYDGECYVKGSIFGCNNAYGSPSGTSEVHIYKTVHLNAGAVTNADPTAGDYELDAVYGGGNKAAYNGTSTRVIIENCDPSIGYVYGGGNAADVTKTYVQIDGAKEIGTVFGGGNGFSATNNHDDPNAPNYNPGANVNGISEVILNGGTIHEVYGGSNSYGDITGGSNVNVSDNSTTCHLNVDHIYGGGRNANMSGSANIILGCQPNSWIEDIYAGSQEADVDGDVNLTITSGKFERVFGGNKTSGKLKGSITVNIEETGNCGTPIIIGELYAGGNEADYSIYGYYQDPEDGNKWKPRTKAQYDTWFASLSATDKLKPENQIKAEPQLNVRAFTSIGAIYGGGYSAKMYANPTVSINVVKGSRYNDAALVEGTTETLNLPYPAHAQGAIGAIGNVYGGGNLATVYGSATVNIGTESKVDFITEPAHLGSSAYTIGTSTPMYKGVTVEGANITGNVYGGGKMANITGNTQVNICAKYNETSQKWESVAPGTAGVAIGGDVYGGGKGEAKESGDRAFYCEDAMVGVEGTNNATNNNSSTYADYGTHVRIGNGTVGTLENGTLKEGTGNVYGGGEIGRVEFHSDVTIGFGDGTGSTTKSPVIYGNVFGAGKGANTHGYSGLVRGDSKVTIQGDAKIGKRVYGGGEMASVGKYVVVDGLPTTPEWGGKCTVTIQGYAEIGPNDMKMVTESGKPDDSGHVFGAGKGVLPYEGVTGEPYSIQPTGKVTYNSAYVPGSDGLDYKAAYLKFIRSLGLASNTDVIIGGNAFVKGSVYGGSENGYVQANTHVTIAGGQVGNGDGVNRPYTETEWTAESTDVLKECAHWTFASPYAPYDLYKDSNSDGKPDAATDGHTFYGNVFGGGRGYYPYAEGDALTSEQITLGYSKGVWLRDAGSVGGNTVVDITGGHILTSVYGGNEQTDVTGRCTINMVSGTVGVPRTKEQIQAHPVTCNVFGAGKGDQRINFNTWTNVASTQVNISGDARIYGSTFGGGEDGHVLGNVETNIGGTVTIGTTNHPYSDVVIGSTGISGSDGNVFGGGRGFSETAKTAGVVGGDVSLNIHNGKILGSVFGGGRLASVGTYFANAEDSNYGKMQDDVTTPAVYYTAEDAEVIGGTKQVGDVKVPASTSSHGHIAITIDGGTIGATASDGKLATTTYTIGDVFGGSKGSTNNNLDYGLVKTTTIAMSGGKVNGSVYGGGEVAVVEGDATITIDGGEVGDGVTKKGGAKIGNVYGGGKGNLDEADAGLIKGNTSVTIDQALGKTTKSTIIYMVAVHTVRWVQSPVQQLLMFLAIHQLQECLLNGQEKQVIQALIRVLPRSTSMVDKLVRMVTRTE